MALTIACVNPKYCVVDFHHGVGFFFGRVKHSCCEDSPVIETASWDMTGRCMTNQKYNLEIEEIYTTDYVAIAACLEPIT